MTSLLHFWQREQDKESFIQAIYSFSEKILTGKINFRRKVILLLRIRDKQNDQDGDTHIHPNK